MKLKKILFAVILVLIIAHPSFAGEKGGSVGNGIFGEQAGKSAKKLFLMQSFCKDADGVTTVTVGQAFEIFDRITPVGSVLSPTVEYKLEKVAAYLKAQNLEYDCNTHDLEIEKPVNVPGGGSSSPMAEDMESS